eukprot:943591-Rhodomonas_salina.1
MFNIFSCTYVLGYDRPWLSSDMRFQVRNKPPPRVVQNTTKREGACLGTSPYPFRRPYALSATDLAFAPTGTLYAVSGTGLAHAATRSPSPSLCPTRCPLVAYHSLLRARYTLPASRLP